MDICNAFAKDKNIQALAKPSKNGLFAMLHLTPFQIRIQLTNNKFTLKRLLIYEKLCRRTFTRIQIWRSKFEDGLSEHSAWAFRHIYQRKKSVYHGIQHTTRTAFMPPILANYIAAFSKSNFTAEELKLVQIALFS